MKALIPTSFQVFTKKVVKYMADYRSPRLRSETDVQRPFRSCRRHDSSPIVSPDPERSRGGTSFFAASATLPFTLLLLLFNCTSPAETTAQTTESMVEPVVPPTELLADFKTWWAYHYERVDLTTNFVPLNENGEQIEKGTFLRQLATGNFFTVQQQTSGGKDQYRLYPLQAPEHPAMSATLKSIGGLEVKRFQMEGMGFPEFQVESLAGKMISNDQLAGKYTVLKTWFIACKPCIVEMPELNELVEEYKDREDVQFISLAIDEPQALREFLTKQPFSYEVIPEQKDFIQKDIHLSVYPTHLVVGPEGKILKVVGNVEQLRRFLKSL